LGRLTYIFQNYIPGVSQITYPEDETTAETEATATTTEATQAATSEATNTTADTSKGCASSLSTALLLTVLPLACAALIRRKED